MAAIPFTENNRSLANAVNKRIDAEKIMVSARASLWRLGAIGLLIMSIGVGVGCVLVGFSYINDDQALADRMAESFAKALEHVRVPVTGNVEMTPGTVTMAEPGTVEMKNPGQVEMTKPGHVEMTKTGRVEQPAQPPIIIERPIPTPHQWNPPSSNPPSNSAKIVTNYTIFKEVAFGTGAVVTGWEFSSSEQTAPTNQYCYYRPELKAEISQTIYLFSSAKVTSAAYQDGGAALSQCIWFNGNQPVTPPASHPSASRPSVDASDLPSSLDSWCAQVKQSSSIALCSNPELRMLAIQRNKLFEMARAKLTDDVYQELLRDQKAWIRSYSTSCGITENVPPALPLSSGILSCMKRAGSARVQHLTRFLTEHGA